MSATTKDLTGLAVGDIIEGRRTYEVDFTAEGRVGLVDVQSGHEFIAYQTETDDDTFRFSVVKKAAKQYNVGDAVYRGEFNDLPRGAVIRFGLTDAGYFKDRNGDWFSADDAASYPVGGFGPEVPYTIRYLP